MATLYLIDGTYNIFRAYHATPKLTNSKGLPTNAAYAFTSMLRKLLNDERPVYVAVVFDTEKPTFRHEAFPEYKAQRPPIEEDLVPQFDLVYRVCAALRVPEPRLEFPCYVRRLSASPQDPLVVSPSQGRHRSPSARPAQPERTPR